MAMNTAYYWFSNHWVLHEWQMLPQYAIQVSTISGESVGKAVSEVHGIVVSEFVSEWQNGAIIVLRTPLVRKVGRSNAFPEEEQEFVSSIIVTIIFRTKYGE